MINRCLVALTLTFLLAACSDDAGNSGQTDQSDSDAQLGDAAYADTGDSDTSTADASGTSTADASDTRAEPDTDQPNTPPTISPIDDQSIEQDASTGGLAFTVADAQTDAAELVVTASSSDTALIPDENLALGYIDDDRAINVTPAADQFGEATITVSVSDGELSAQTQFLVTVLKGNEAPTISAIASQNIDEDASTGELAFTIGDDETLDTLIVSATSSDTTLIPEANITLAGTDAARTVAVMPAADQHGTALITVSVSDGELSADTAFEVVVNPVDDYRPMKITAAEYHSCGVQNDGSLACWGNSLSNRLDSPAGTDFVEVSAGSSHTCALKADGSIVCWGFDANERLDAPAVGDFVQLDAGPMHTCAVASDGSVSCWGTAGHGGEVPPAGNDFVQVSAGRGHSCAVKTDGSVACWGLTDFFGTEDLGQATPPTGTDFFQVTAGQYHSCAVKTDHSIECWGSDSLGQATAPTGNDFYQVAAGKYNNCAVRLDGSLHCWGSTHSGSTAAPLGLDYFVVDASGSHSCAQKTDGSFTCWGSDYYGQSTPP